MDIVESNNRSENEIIAIIHELQKLFARFACKEFAVDSRCEGGVYIQRNSREKFLFVFTTADRITAKFIVNVNDVSKKYVFYLVKKIIESITEKRKQRHNNVIEIATAKEISLINGAKNG